MLNLISKTISNEYKIVGNEKTQPIFLAIKGKKLSFIIDKFDNSPKSRLAAKIATLVNTNIFSASKLSTQLRLALIPKELCTALTNTIYSELKEEKNQETQDDKNAAFNALTRSSDDALRLSIETSNPLNSNYKKELTYHAKAIKRFIKDNFTTDESKNLVSALDVRTAYINKAFTLSALHTYIQKRTSEKSPHFSFWGRLKGMDDKVKISAAKKMIGLLDNKPIAPFTDLELTALRDCRLGKIISRCQNLPKEFLLAESKHSSFDSAQFRSH